MRLPVIGVMGSGHRPWSERSAALGSWLALAGFHLLTGGGGGVMAAVSRAFTETEGRRGLVLGVLPADLDQVSRSPDGYPNPWVEIAIRTHLPFSGERGLEPSSRNHINVLSSDVIVCLPGSAGTRSEAELALRYRRPIVAWLEDRSELPGCPSEIATSATLAGVQRFVTEALETGAPERRERL